MSAFAPRVRRLSTGIGARPIAALLLGIVMLLGSGECAAAQDWSHARYLLVTMFDYRFEPSQLTLRRGVAYRLLLVNRGKELHELTAPDFLKTVVLGNPRVLNDTDSELAVPPGQARDLSLIPEKAGRYRFYCADHDWAGMLGEITVR